VANNFKINMLQYISVFAIVIFFTSFLSFSEAAEPDWLNAEESNPYLVCQRWLDIGCPDDLVFDDDYILEKFVTGLNFPTAMDFIGNDLLVLEKNTGKVIRINENGEIDKEPVLVIPVSPNAEGGLLGIATTPNHVFLYFTEFLKPNVKGIGFVVEKTLVPKNTVYQYDWDGKNLTNPILIKKFSADSPIHNGGVFAKGQNNEIYFVIGDDQKNTIFQNIPSVPSNNETSSIFKMYTDDNNRVELFAVGIRNSFGLAVDPATGYLWETENGENIYDEINLVKNRFNSGWKSMMGPSDRVDARLTLPTHDIHIPPQSLEGFIYSDPEFSWHTSVGVTAIAFPDMNNFGKYQDWLFVGDINNGKIYKFQLNSDRTEFIFSTPSLKDLVYDDDDGKLNEIIFAEGFLGGITDIKFGHDAMYVISPFDNGSIYKIYPKQPIPPPTPTTEQDQQQSEGGGCLIATATFGSEMAPQVQFLRELRDNTVLQTESGTSFMTGFNQFYYSFSPYIADYERENPAFKETVKIALTPLLTSLTLLQYADIDSESEMLGYGIGVILLNIGMYFMAPAVLLSACIRKIPSKK